VFPSVALAADPTVVTGVSTDITDSGAAIWGGVTSFGDYSDTYVYLSFDYATEGYFSEYGSYDRNTPEIEWQVADGVTDYSTTLTGLPNQTTYHYRAKIRFGNDYVYGLDAEFSTCMLPPDSVPKIKFLKAYKDLLETDDCLFVLMVDIPYSTIPDIPVNRAFIVSMMDSGDEIGWNTGYALNDNGYNYNVYSLYFDAADAIDWGNDTDYNIAISGSPDVFTGTIPYYDNLDSPDYNVLSDAWVDLDDYDNCDTYSEALTWDLLTVLKVLEQEWQVVLLDEQETKSVLSSNGEKLLRNAIPGIQSMAPGLFFVQSTEIDTSERSWGTSLTDTYKQRLLGPDGQPGGGDDNAYVVGLVETADWLNVPFLALLSFICIAVCVFAIYQSMKRWGTALPGYGASIIIILCFSLLILGLTAYALIGLFLVLMTGWVLFMRRA